MSFDEHERRSRHYPLPDNLVGIGGAGKAVVDRFCAQEWIVENGVAATDDGYPPEGFRAYIVDTATDERADDEARVAEHNDRIERIATESGRTLGTVATELRYLNPIDHAPEALLSGTDATAGDIDGDAEPNAWWLRDEAVMRDGDDGLGTVRRRALGKALLQANWFGDGEMADFAEQLAESETTIVAGLGGGTGSGMAIELAKRIAETDGRGVNLVGILPAVDEPEPHLANAYAALSELEYLAVNDQNPFRNVVLVPRDPASDLEYDESFLDGVLRTIIAREQLGVTANYLNESSPDPPPQYAPFTLATPQTLRYNVEDIRRVERSLQEYCDEKRRALDVELELYRTLEEHLREEWGADVAEALETSRSGDDPLPDHEAGALRRRLDDLRSWLDDGTFEQAQWAAIRDWQDQLEAWTPDGQGADSPDAAAPGEFLSSLADRVDHLESVEEVHPAEPDDQMLAGVLRDEVRAIGRRAKLLRAREVLESDAPEAAAAVTAAMEPAGDVFAADRELETAIVETGERLDQYGENREVLGELESELVAERDELLGRWGDAVADDIDALVALENDAEEIRSHLDAVETEVERRFTAVEQATAPEDLPQDARVSDLDELNHRLSTAGLDPVDADAIRQSVEHAAMAFEAWNEYNRDSILDAIPIHDRKGDARERYLSHVSSIDDRFVQVDPANEDLEAEFRVQSSVRDRFDEVRDDLREKRRRHRERLVDELERLLSEWDASAVVDPYRDRWVGGDFDIGLPDVPNDASDRLDEAIAGALEAGSARAVREELLATPARNGSGGTARAVLDEALLEPIQRRRERLEAEVTAAEGRIERAERLREIVTGLGSEFERVGPVRPEVRDPPRVGSDADDPYVTKVEAHDPFGLRQYEDIAEADVWNRFDDAEWRKIESQFRQFAANVLRDRRLRGFERDRIEAPVGKEYAGVRKPAYDGHHVVNVFLSRAFPDDRSPPQSIFTDVREEFEQSNLYFRHDGGYSHQSVGFGGPWDLSMVTFVSGVFLDDVQGIDRYKEAYEAQRAELGEAIRIRHAHGLDGRDHELGDGVEGGYVSRDALLDLEDPEDRYTLLDATEREMTDLLREKYIGQETVPGSDTTD